MRQSLRYGPLEAKGILRVHANYVQNDKAIHCQFQFGHRKTQLRFVLKYVKPKYRRIIFIVKTPDRNLLRFVKASLVLYVRRSRMSINKKGRQPPMATNVTN